MTSAGFRASIAECETMEITRAIARVIRSNSLPTCPIYSRPTHTASTR
jgi:hypothetical protein